MTFRENLIRLRRQNGLTQEQLGEIAGVSRQTVSKWELGDTTPELEKLHLLCDHFQISMDELTGRSVPGASAPPWEWNWQCWQYEYKSGKTLFGLPLVHINLSQGAKPRRAKGVIAIGNLAQGFVALGGVSVGLLSLGGVSVGLIALGGFGAGVLSIAGISVGVLALGAISCGVCAIGSIALGAYARGAVTMEWSTLLLHLLRLISGK